MNVYEEYLELCAPDAETMAQQMVTQARPALQAADPVMFSEPTLQKIGRRAADKLKAFYPAAAKQTAEILPEFMTEEEAKALVELGHKFPGIFQRQAAAGARVGAIIAAEAEALGQAALMEVLQEEGKA